MAIATLFKHRKPFIRVVGESTKTYTFVNHMYFTILPGEIKELTKMAEDDGNGIYIDPNETSIDTECLDPTAKLEKSIREKLMDELRREGKLLEDSTSDQSAKLVGAVNTSSSTLNQNSAAERTEQERNALADAARADAVIKNNPTLDALNKLKQGGNPEQK